MMHDIWTVTRKEWLEILEQLLRFRRGGWSLLLVVLFLGVISPLQMGAAWLSSSLIFIYWPMLTSSMTSTLIADSVAGERERHTLETLLASRLSDTAILVGKLLAAVMYGYAFALVNLTLGFIVVNIVHWRGAGGFVGMEPMRVLALLSLIGASALFISGLGVFVSLRAATVRQAQQTFGVIMLVLLMLPVLFFQFVSPVRQQLVIGRAAEIGVVQISLRIAAVLAVAALTFNLAAIRRFKRGQLALE